MAKEIYEVTLLDKNHRNGRTVLVTAQTSSRAIATAKLIPSMPRNLRYGHAKIWNPETSAIGREMLASGYLRRVPEEIGPLSKIEPRE